MALTKVKLISDGVIVQGNLHSSHGITTAHIGEGSNLYYTDARVDTRVGNLNTGNLPEGSNLYYTNARADARIAAASTSDLSEGTNLYYTDARADARVALIVDSSPATLNTLNELAAALGDDPNFATTTANSIGTKLPLAGGTLTGGLTGTTAGFSGSITASGNSNSFGNTTIGALAASTGTFSASVTAAGNSNSFGTSTFTGGVTLGNILLTPATIPGANTPSINLHSTNNEIYIQSGSAHIFNFIRYDNRNSMMNIESTGISVTGGGTFSGTLTVNGSGGSVFNSTSASNHIIAAYRATNGNNVATFRTTDSGHIFRIHAQNAGSIYIQNDDGSNYIKIPDSGSNEVAGNSTFTGMILLDGVNQIRFLPQAGESYNEAMRIIRSSDTIGFHYGQNANEEAFTIDKDGNSRVYHKLGIRVDGDAIPWRGTAQIPAVINLAGNGAVFTRPDNTFLSQNFYYNVSDIGAVIDPGKGSIIQLTTGDIIFSGTTTGASGGDQISIQERMRIDGNGQMTYQGAEPGTTGIRFQGSGTCNGYAGSYLNYYTMDVMRDQGSGKAINSQGTISIADGYGIEFGASQGAGATSTLLDDYEEGTWTPVPKGSTTVGTFSSPAGHQSGTYTKIGKTVHISMILYATSFTGVGDFEIHGLPFAVGGSAGTMAVQANSPPWTLSVNNQNIAAYPTLTKIAFRATNWQGGGGMIVAQCGGSTTIGYIRISGVYHV